MRNVGMKISFKVSEAEDRKALQKASEDNSKPRISGEQMRQILSQTSRTN